MSKRAVKTLHVYNCGEAMKILVTGANGRIDSSICGRLIREGHQVVAIVRPASRPLFGVANTTHLDVATATAIDRWLPVLACETAVS